MDSEFEAVDGDASLRSDGAALLVFLTADQRVSLHTTRKVLEDLAFRIKRELDRVPSPSVRR